MFSERTHWPSTPNELTRAVDARQSSNKAILDLTETNPTRCGFVYPESIFSALAAPHSTHYEPDPQGTPSARNAIAGYYEARGRDMGPETGRRAEPAIGPGDIFLTSGTSESYSHLLKLLCDAGGEVLAPVPSYPLIEHIGKICDVRVRPYNLHYNGSWDIDIESIARHTTSKVRALILVSPHNPTGNEPDREAYQKILAIARERGLAVIIDEVFAGYTIGDKSKLRNFADFLLPAAGTDGTGPAVFLLNGLSKMVGLPQLKVGWIAVAQAGGARADLIHRLSMLCDTFLSVNTPAQGALPEIFAASAVVREQIISRINRNYTVLMGSIGEGSPLTVLQASAGWTAIIRVPNVRTDEVWAVGVLEERGVLVQPGHYFNLEGEMLIVSLLPQEEAFSRGVAELVAYVSENS